MNIRRRLYMMTSSLAVFGMVGAPMRVVAQDAGADAPYTASESADPPARVGRLATMEGTVSYHTQSEDHWSPAVINAPVAPGDAYWTEPQALAEVQMDASSIWMDSSTEFDLTTLDDTSMHAATPQGEVYLHLKALQPSETYVLETPRGTVTLATDGRYDIVAGDTGSPTTVTVLDGAAQISGNNISLQVHANQTASISGDTTFQGSVGPISQDEFLTAMLKREQPAPVQRRGVAAPPVVAQMTGGAELDRYGSWEDNSDYGNVWYPQVDNGWAPYREGRWSYVAPWGWTWVDAAPWGFAPFHYGRWVQVGPRWGWAPVYPGYRPVAYRPVYAPALVSFFGIGAVGVGIGVGIGLGLGAAYGPGANVGWVPLGAREPYYPPYRVSRTYVNRVNVINIRNTTNIYNEIGTRRQLPIERYANARAATVVPARAMAESRPVGRDFRRPNAAELSGARGLVDRAPIAPSARTVGLTPRVAQQLKVPDVQQRRAPGPQVAPAADRPAGNRQPALRPARADRPGGQDAGKGREPNGAAGRPGAQPDNRPAGPRENQNGGLPALRAPGTRPDANPARTTAGRQQEGAPGPQIDRKPGEAREGQPALREGGAAGRDRVRPNASEAARPDASAPGKAAPDATPPRAEQPKRDVPRQAARPERPVQPARPAQTERPAQPNRVPDATRPQQTAPDGAAQRQRAQQAEQARQQAQQARQQSGQQREQAQQARQAAQQRAQQAGEARQQAAQQQQQQQRAAQQQQRQQQQRAPQQQQRPQQQQQQRAALQQRQQEQQRPQPQHPDKKPGDGPG